MNHTVLTLAFIIDLLIYLIRVQCQMLPIGYVWPDILWPLVKVIEELGWNNRCWNDSERLYRRRSTKLSPVKYRDLDGIHSRYLCKLLQL